jgi:hypothetical protein
VAFEPKRKTARFHDPACRKRASRARAVLKRASAAEVETAAVVEDSPVYRDGLLAAVRRELERFERADSALGQAALELARRIEVGVGETGSAIASMTRELRETLSAATANAKSQGSVVDELRAKRESRRA